MPASLSGIAQTPQADPEALRSTGGRIRRARVESGLSEDALGQRVGISGVTVHLYETGMADPGENLAAIAEVTGRPLAWFTGALPDVDAPPEPQEVVAEPEPQPEAVVEREPEPEPEPAAQPEPEAVAEPDPVPAEPGPAEPQPEAVAEPGPAIEPAPAPEIEPVPAPEVESAPLPELEPEAREHVHPHHLSGNTMIVDTGDRGHIRVIASRDPESGRYVAEYEVMTVESWQGKQLSVWQPLRDYRPGEGATVDECLEAALGEIEAGPRPPEPEDAEHEALTEEPEPEPEPGPRRRLFGRRRGR